VKSGVHPAIRSVLFIPFFVASNAIGMGLTGTCPIRARKGMRDIGDGDAPVADRNERQSLASRGRALALGAVGFACTVTALFALT